jgi:hypothetical protein
MSWACQAAKYLVAVSSGLSCGGDEGVKVGVGTGTGVDAGASAISSERVGEGEGDGEATTAPGEAVTPYTPKAMIATVEAISAMSHRRRIIACSLWFSMGAYQIKDHKGCEHG